MNLFAAQKYYYYCDLGAIICRLEVDGPCIVKISGCKKNAASGISSEIIQTQTLDAGVSDIPLPDVSHYEGVYFSLFYSAKTPVRLLSGGWYTDANGKRDEKLAIITCTFKREKYVNRNISLYERFVNSHPEYRERMHLYVIDNGRTLDVSRGNADVTIIPNMNAGGAGGFTRGLLEVTKEGAASCFDRILLMDDDVEVLPDTFAKTLNLCDFLKDEYRDAFIGGCMLSLNDRGLLIEDLAIQSELWVRPFHAFVDLRTLDGVMQVNEIHPELFGNDDERTDSAWWYCCFSMEMLKRKGLPLPVFFRGDDLEFGWRHNEQHHIIMNGIGNWHSPFEYRVSALADYYYLPRNMFMVHCLYNRNISRQWRRHFKRMYLYLKGTFNYASMELFLTALKDILNARQTFTRNPEEQFRDLSAIAKRVEWHPVEEEMGFPDFDDMPDGGFNKIGFHLRRMTRKIIGGILARVDISIPDFLCQGEARVRDWYPPIGSFVFKREVKVYNLLTHRYCIRRHDASLERKYRKEFKSLMAEIGKRFDSLQSEFVSLHREFTSREFWENYLCLKEKP